MKRAKKSLLKPRWSKVLADLWENKTRTLLVVASIAVGVFAIGTIMNAYFILSDDLDASFQSVNPANIEILTDPFDENFLKSIEEIPGVARTEGRRLVNVNVIQEGKPFKNLDLMALEDFKETKINLLEPVMGVPIPDENQVVVGFEPMRASGFEVGEVLPIQLLDGTVRNFKVVGFVADQNSGMDFSSPIRAYITTDSLERLGVPDSLNRLYARVSGDSNDEAYIESVADAIEDKIEKSGREVYRTQTSKSDEHPFGDMVLAIFGVLGALGLLVMLLSGSLIYNTLNALIAQHLRQIGVMKLVGGRSFQIQGMYLTLILVYGLIALAIAIPLGALAGYGLAQLIAYLMKSNLLGFRFFPVTIVVQVLTAILVPLVSGFIPIRSGSKIKVRRAISNDRPGEKVKLSSIWEMFGRTFGWLSRPIILSLRNTFRRRGRLILTLFTLTISGAIFIAVFNVRVSMQSFMDRLQQHFIADVTVNFDQPYRISRVEQAVFQVPGIEKIEAWTGTIGEIVDEEGENLQNLQIVAPPAESELINPEMVAGRWFVPGDENAIVISDGIWETMPDIRAGETLHIKIDDGREEEWKVIGLFRFTNFVGDPLSYAPYETISKLQNQSNASASFRVVTSDHSMAAQERISAHVDQYLRERGFKVAEVQTGAEARKQSSDMIDILVIFLLIMALLTAVVGSIGLTGTMGMNVLERTREIGVMRVIGAVDMAIIKAVVVEGAFIGFISWCLAVLLSFPISYLLLEIISTSMFRSPMELVFTLDGMLIWLAVVMGLSIFASVIPAHSAARLTIREVLAYE